MTPQDLFMVCICARRRRSHTWMRHNKLSPEAGLGLEVDHKAALFVYAHAGGIHGPCESKTQFYNFTLAFLL